MGQEANLLLLGVGGATAAPAGGDALLMEDSGYVLLETGDHILKE